MKNSSRLFGRPLLMLVLLLGMGCGVAQVANEGVSPSDYFPLKIGHAWTFATFDSTGRQLSDSWSYRISSTSESGGSIIFYGDITGYRDPSSGRTSFQDPFYRDNTGIYTLGSSGDFAERRIAYPITMEKEWEFSAPRVVRDGSGNETTYLRRAKALLKESVSLSKGMKFEDALKVSYIVEGPSRPAETLRWYAPGVGMVKEVRVFDPNRVTELTGYFFTSNIIP